MSRKKIENNSIVFVKLNKVLLIYILMLTTAFSLVFIITYSDLKYRVSSSVIKETSSGIPADFFVKVVSYEIPQLKQTLVTKEDDSSILRSLLNFVTNIKLGDARSFLGREIPGFTSFNTEIVVAGMGTDLTNLPIESAPPIEVLLKESEMANSKQNDSSDSSNTPIAPENSAVFIYHSHSWESFKPLLKNVTNNDQAVSFNENANIIAVGNMLKEELVKKGIGVQHSTANVTNELKKRNWNYNNSYALSRQHIQEAMAVQETIHYLIDIHRDSQPKKLTTTTINGQPLARLFFIVGKENKNYEQNLQVAKEINAKLEEKFPGISRGVFVKGKDEGNGVYNQDLSDRALLIEFGGVENTLEELDNTTKAFAEVFSEYYMKAEAL